LSSARRSPEQATTLTRTGHGLIYTLHTLTFFDFFLNLHVCQCWWLSMENCIYAGCQLTKQLTGKCHCWMFHPLIISLLNVYRWLI
jgi:hypothetical protein